MGKLKQSKMLKAKWTFKGIFRARMAQSLRRRYHVSKRTQEKEKKRKRLFLDFFFFFFTTEIFFKLEKSKKAILSE